MVVDTGDSEDFEELFSKPLPSMPYGAPGQAFVALRKPEGAISVGKFTNCLKFVVKEVILDWPVISTPGLELKVVRIYR